MLPESGVDHHDLGFDMERRRCRTVADSCKSSHHNITKGTILFLPAGSVPPWRKKAVTRRMRGPTIYSLFHVVYPTLSKTVTLVVPHLLIHCVLCNHHLIILLFPLVCQILSSAYRLPIIPSVICRPHIVLFCSFSPLRAQLQEYKSHPQLSSMLL